MSNRRSPLALATFAGLSLIATTGCASRSVELDFVPHAQFFSTEAKQQPPLDPQVFVRDATGTAGVGPQNIAHMAGFRNALLSDPGSSAIYNAQGMPLDGFTLGSWLGAKGEVEIKSDDSGRATIEVELSGLRPNGVYTLFENHFDQQPVGFTPLDGTGAANSFVAGPNGKARFELTAPHIPTHDNAVLLVYQSDGKSHGTERGQIGVNAHHQLIARIPPRQ
ncbi:MAG: hypothetical protein ABIS03_13210 [Gemmatimonadaceae bacterium]